MKIFKTYEKLDVGTGDSCEMALRVTYLYTGTTEEITKVESQLKQFGRTTVADVKIVPT